MEIYWTSKNPSISEQINKLDIPQKTRESCLKIEKYLEYISELNIDGIIPDTTYRSYKNRILLKAARIKF